MSLDKEVVKLKAAKSPSFLTSTFNSVMAGLVPAIHRAASAAGGLDRQR
jgi:hypothetical protein